MYAEKVVNVLKSVLGNTEDLIPLHEPRFQGNESNYLLDCIESTFVSSVGKYVDRFEKDLAEYTGAKYAVAVVNGTCALHISLKLSGLEVDEEVLIPSLTFVATANAVRYCGGIPHFVDSDEHTLGLSPEALRERLKQIAEPTNGVFRNRNTGRRLRALIPMHTFGHPCAIDEIQNVAHDYKLEIIEDAAESLGSFYQGKHTGTFGLFGTLSFNGNKIITTGGGGAILTNDSLLAKNAKHITTTAKLPHKWEYCHDQVAYNYRMPNINAALGCAQLEELPTFLKAKRKLFGKYSKAFASFKNLEIFKEPNDCLSNYWLQTMLLDEKYSKHRDSILLASNNANIMTRPAWVLIHELAPYRDCPVMDVPIAKALYSRLINIPSSPFVDK